MKFTDFLRLKKPELDDPMDINDLNANFDAIDAEIEISSEYREKLDGIAYGVCDTAKGTTAKVINCPGFKLHDGARIMVSFTNGNTASYMTLNVNGTGACFAWFPVHSSRAYNNEIISKYIIGGCLYEFMYQAGSTPKWMFCGMAKTPIEYEAPAYSEASSLENLSSGEVLSTAFGKIKKAISSLVSHINNTSNPHGVTKSQITDFPSTMPNPNSLTLTMNGSSTSYSGSSSASKTWYAPTSYGTAGYELVAAGSGNAPVWKAPNYGVCSVSSSTAAKTVSISNFKLVTGVRVLVKFSNEHSSSTAATLNVNSTGEKTIVVHCGTNNVFVQNYFSWLAGETVEFVYDGEYWVAIASDMRFITGAQSATVVIGTTRTQGYCDFRCDGTNDSQCFNNAINRLKIIMGRNPPSENSIWWRYGGTILVKTGSYHLTDKLNIGNNFIAATYTIQGEGHYGTWIHTNGLECLVNGFDSLVFSNLTLECKGLKNGSYFTGGTNLTFDNCYITIGSETSNVGVFASISKADAGSSDYSSIAQGCFTLQDSIMEISTTGSEANCYSGITCGIIRVDNSQIHLKNSSNTSSFELNFLYDARSGYISNSYFVCSGKTSIVNTGDINMYGNVFYLNTSGTKIYHYNASDITSGGTFTGNIVYSTYYIYLRCSTITGNKFAKTRNIAANAGTCYFYNTCPATITGNYFDGGTTSSQTHGAWYMYFNNCKIICQQNTYLGNLIQNSYATESLISDNLKVSQT